MPGRRRRNNTEADSCARVMAPTFYIIDGHAQIYRAFYAPFGELTSPTGEPTRATHVFCQMLFNLIRERKPDYLAMTMDVSDETVFRCDIDRNYKSNRDAAPEGLHVQVERIASIVSALGIPIFREPRFEADDLMATMVERLRKEDVNIFLVSKDKDLDQLLSDRVRLYDPSTDAVLDTTALLQSKGYAPEQAVEVQTLVGDTTDNIPGVPGIGPKTAARLIAQYGSAQAVVDHAHELTPKMAERVKAFAPQLSLTRQLVTLRRDVPFAFQLTDCRLARLNVAAARPIFAELNFTRLRDVLESFAGQSDQQPVAVEHRSQPGAQSGQYHLIDSLSLLDAFAAELARQPAFAFDTETTSLNPVQADLVGLSFAWKAGEAYYLPVRGTMGPLLPVDAVVARLKPVLENSSIAKIGHNSKYDILVARRLGISVAGVEFDTLLASFLLDPQRASHSLDSLAKTHFGHDMIPITDLIGKGKDQFTMDQVDTRRACEYAAEDADFTWQLAELFRPRIRGSHVERLFHETEMPLVEVLVEMEHHGIALNVKLLAELGESIEASLVELTRDVHRAAGHSFNIDSPKQLAAVLFDEQGLNVVKRTKTGRSTDAETLEALAAQSDHPIPRMVLEYRELAKLKGTYVDTLPRMVYPRTGRVHAHFNQTGAITGRLSSNDPNLQNIPVRTEMGRRIREAIVPGRPDCVLLAADYSQIELRLLAHFSQDPALLEAFYSGQDVHSAVAAQVNGVPLEEVTAAQRSAAKAVNFGIIYGQSAFGLSRSLGIPVGTAKAFIDTYFQRYPGIRIFIDQCVADARRTGYAETILGRRRPIEELRSRNRAQVAFGERIAVNTVVQGSAADLIKRAMIDIHRRIQSGVYSARMLIQVHDELVFEVPFADMEREAEMIRGHMANAIPLRVPIVVDIRWGRNWAEGKVLT